LDSSVAASSLGSAGVASSTTGSSTFFSSFFSSATFSFSSKFLLGCLGLAFKAELNPKINKYLNN
jgi:hypothetical protein